MSAIGWHQHAQAVPVAYPGLRWEAKLQKNFSHDPMSGERGAKGPQAIRSLVSQIIFYIVKFIAVKCIHVGSRCYIYTVIYLQIIWIKFESCNNLSGFS